VNATWILVVAVGLYVATAAVTDLRMRRIPNYLTVPTALLGLAYHTLAPGGYGFWVALGGFGVGLALLMLPALAGGSGMGDVKLLAALGAWFGTQGLLVAFVFAALIASVIALSVIVGSVFRRGVSKTSRRYVAARRPTGKHRRPQPRVIPFAVPVAMSTYLVLTWMVVRGGL